MIVKKVTGIKFKKRLHFYKSQIDKQSALLKIVFILSLLINNYEYYYYNKIGINLTKEPIIRIFIVAHKNFKNYRYNPAYSIVFNGKSKFNNNYNLDVIFANNTRLNKMGRAYGEMAQLYYIYELYKKGIISSKYVGLNHYSKYFYFKDNIPNLDAIFKNYDVILLRPYRADRMGMKHQFCRAHICSAYNQVINIIKEIKPDYYKTAIRTQRETNIYLKNLFIMKKKDFLKLCEFEFDILFEFDRRNNLTSDEDVLNFVNKHYHDGRNHYFQSRLEGFLSERIANIFYYHNFRRRNHFRITYNKNAKKGINKTILKQLHIKKRRIKIATKVVITSMVINIIILLVILLHKF